MLDELYVARREDREAFGEYWCGPEKFSSFEETLVARYPKDPSDGDGQSVEVYCCAAPARFYSVKVLAEPNGMGEMQQGFELQTGSGCRDFVIDIAVAVSKGMLGLAEKVR